MSKPFSKNYSVVNTFASDGDRYFLKSDSPKWKRKLVKLEPDSGEISVFDVPNDFDMPFDF